MKTKQIIFSLVALALLATACEKGEKVETGEKVEDQAQVRPAKQADFVIYSGHHTHLSTFENGAKAPARGKKASFSYYKVQDGNVPAEYRDLIPAAVTQEERTYVLDYIRQHPNEHRAEWNHSVYFLQNIGSSYAYYSGSTLVDRNGAWHGVTGGNHMDYLVINNEHINDYNAAWGPDALCVNLPFDDPTYHDSWGDKDNTKHNAWTLYQIPEYGYYLCFDYRTAKNSGEYYDGDGVYNDWVIKLTPADGNTEEVIPTEPIVTPIEQTGSKDGHVEVNLSINAEKEEGDYISSKLSIHVRDTTDVEVFLPVRVEYYCDRDDMNIVLSNPQGIYRYNDYVQYVSMEVAGQTVTMTVRFEEEGIRISTQGINAEVLKYCRASYLDGITFEIWNYYRDTTREEIHGWLDRSTVSFTANPGYYVNAFGPLEHDEGTEPNPLDCTVTPPAGWVRNNTDLFSRIYRID